MKLGAVVVLYHPQEAQLKALVKSLIQQVDTLCLVDNSLEVSKWLNNLLEQYPERITFISYGQNLGIAKAQNIGLQALQKDACKFGFLFDQDSQVSSDFAPKMRMAWERSADRGERLAAIGPQVICHFSEKKVTPSIQRALRHCADLRIVPQLISSGMFLDLAILNEKSYKEEALFIDGVDHEWCWRMRACGFSVGIANSVYMLHQLGEGRRRVLGISYKQTAPPRLYYQFRNYFLLVRRRYVPLYWKFRNALVLPMRFLVNALLEKGRGERIRYMLKGIVHGLKGIDGPL